MAKKNSFRIPIILGLIAAAVLSAALVFEFDAPSRVQKDTITILRGQNAMQIANDLKAEKYIESKIGFMIQVISEGNLKNLKAGEYDLKGLNQQAIIDKLTRGQSVDKLLVVVPGQDVQDILAALPKSGISKSDFLESVRASKYDNDFDFLAKLPQDATLEGFLYPDSYRLPQVPDAEYAVRLMLDNFDKKITSEWRGEIAKQKKTVFEIITMASMLEKEVVTLEDKKIVSGILWKRIALDMPLQVDSTVLYGNGNVFDVDSKSPYNTYRSTGLPPGPICNPGLDSIEAAIFPQKTEHLYYLSSKSGETIFSKTYGEHLINKAKHLD